jgi:hypothetical protein
MICPFLTGFRPISKKTSRNLITSRQTASHSRAKANRQVTPENESAWRSKMNLLLKLFQKNHRKVNNFAHKVQVGFSNCVVS